MTQEDNNTGLSQIASVNEIVEDLRQGKMVILVDEEDRENEGDLLMAADFVTPEAINFMVTHARGLVCLTLTEERCQQLDLAMMTTHNGSSFGTNFTLSIEAAEGVTTGISAADRARTIKAAVAPNAKPSDVVQPGHIFPVRAVQGGVLIRAGHTEAGCDLTRMAGLTPAAVICEILKPDGTMARLPDLIEFGKEHNIKIGTIADLIQYRSEHESMVQRIAEKTLNTPWGEFKAIAYRDKASGAPHIALVHGEISADEETLVRVHEPVTALDFLDKDSLAHSWTMDKALARIQQARSGVVVLLNAQGSEERLFSRLEGWNDASGTKKVAERYDLRTYGVGAQILRDLNVGKMRLLAVPRKMPSMTGYALTVTGYETDE